MGWKNFISAFSLVAILLSGCKEDRISSGKNDGIVSWKGLVAADGCDWLIEIGNDLYHPDNLPEDFKVDGLKVKINYSVKPPSDNFHCSMNPSTFYRTIHIKSISAK